MDWIEKALEGIENAADAAAKIRSELPKNFIPKDKYNALAESKRQLEEKLNEGMKEKLCNAAIKYALEGCKVRDEKIVKMLIDKQTLEVGEDGGICGLDEQIKAIKKEKPYLFACDTLEGRAPFAGGADAPKVTREQFSQMGYRERIRLYEEQPELYKNLNS